MIFSACASPETTLRANVGKNACNSVNGTYRGRILDVFEDESHTWIYVVEREGVRGRAPAGGTTVTEGRCSDGNPTVKTQPHAQTGAPSPVVPSAPLQPVAAEFRKRLARYHGELQMLELRDHVIEASWTSQRCDMIEGEVTDFLISLHRGHPSPVQGEIKAHRRCGDEKREFQLSSVQFQRYRTGQIGDVEVLRGIR